MEDWGLGSFKATGRDGLQGIFYQSQWKVVEQALCNLIIK